MANKRRPPDEGEGEGPSVRSPAPLDPVTMARFLVLPGATDLLDAFSRIPIGKLRDSVIIHAQVIAETYSGAPAEMQMPDPLLAAARVAVQALPPPPAAAVRQRRAPTSLDERIVMLRMDGKRVNEIAQETGATILVVESTLKAATRAGVPFPRIAKGSHIGKRFVTRMEEIFGQGRSPMESAAAKRGMSLEAYVEARAKFVDLRRRKTPIDEIAKATGIEEKTLWGWLYSARAAGIDLPTRLDFEDAEVEDISPPGEPEAAHSAPAAPVKASKLQTPPKGVGRYALSRYDVAPHHHRMIAAAAEALGVTPEGYFAMRREAARLIRGGSTVAEMGRALGLGQKRAANWHYAMRHGGVLAPDFVVPSEDEVEAPAMEPDPEFEAPVLADGTSRRYLPALETMKASARQQVEHAAAKRSMTTRAYMDMRESCVRHRLAGMGPREIARLVGEKPTFVKDTLDAARERGAVFPALTPNPFDEMHARMELAEDRGAA